MKAHVTSVTSLFPTLIGILLMLFTVTCIFIIPFVSYLLSYRYFAEKDSAKNDSDVATITVAKASGMAIVGFVGGLVLFSLVTISGMGLDKVLSGSGDGIGKVVLSLLLLKY
ncbi:hypothetical protein [Poseidonibacter ostreae]|uniref:Uncharacterized protein n=1 Tax=Poseidonibacter ostreae TaxID=2654171 RepID=A0A6L4WWU4_9BACT|nr:hypothetical protein [Poseidonibacter ostreae]KAB7891315.1 hypothetical protein GBG19_00330 [Poseidonibacter ostreae]